MKTTLYGVDGRRALFNVDGKGVVVNTSSLTASTVDLDRADEIGTWLPPSPSAPISAWADVARCATSQSSTPDVTITASGSINRAYTVPKAASKAARSALVGRDGLTAVSTHIASLLSSGRQVTLKDIRWMSRFFNRNHRDYTPDSRWRAWGGDAARSWVLGLQEKTRGVTAAGDVEVNLLGFYEGDENERAFWAEKPDPDGEHVITLFKKTPANTWLAWGDGDWFECEQPDAATSGRLVELDDDTAVYVAGALYDAPDTPVSLRDMDPEQWDLVQEGLAGIDWELVDRVMTKEALKAAGNEYTPEERSRNARAQLRDANGRFAKIGDSGTMKSGMGARIVTVNPVDNTLIVEGSDGNSYAVPANEFEVGGQPRQVTTPQQPSTLPPLNTDEILAQPRVSKNTPKAWLKNLLQPMGPAQIKQVIDDYTSFVRDERQRRGTDFPGGTPFGEPKPTLEEIQRQRELRKGIRQHERRARRALRQAAVSDQVLQLDPSPSDDKLTPETSDVEPLYLAIVDREDTRAVVDLVALTPESTTSNEPTAYRRVAGDWVEDVKILQDLRSPTPPPVVQLDDETYQDVLQQVDDSLESENPEPIAASISFEPATILAWDEDGNMVGLVSAAYFDDPVTAAGGVDRNRGNAERLRRYWLYGPGAAKIRWNTPGDWRRCVRQLSKHLGPRAKGYCSLRHKEATGMWPGDRRNRKSYSITAGGDLLSSMDDVITEKAVLAASAAEARKQAALMRVYGNSGQFTGPPVPSSENDVTDDRLGRRFKIPLVIPEGIESGDGRIFEKGSLSIRSNFPLPLMWQEKTSDGHDNSVVVGRVDYVERLPHGLGNAYGYMDIGPYGREAERMIDNKMLRFVSADLDRFEADEDELAGDDDDGSLKRRKIRVRKGRLMGITIVPKPAFQECTIELEPLEKEIPVSSGAYVGEPTLEEAAAVVASAGIAEAIPVEPPRAWFERPILNGPSPITVTDEGQIFGHIATWDRDHIGLPNATQAPRSYSNYAYFHTGVLRCNDGTDVPVGQLTLAGGHADLMADAYAAVKHYDDTGSAVADVRAGEDSYGIWIAGALRPGTTPEQIRALRASAPSGDWRNINGRLELVAICQVNVPGFPVPRAQVASGALSALVAAGTSVLSKMRMTPMEELQSRIKRLEEHEQRRDKARAEAAVSKVAEALSERQEKTSELNALAAAARARVFKALDVDGYLTEFKNFSPEKREQLAREKKALKDGSFPIENTADLRRAIQAYGRASESKRGQVRRHIVRRARALGKENMIPEQWSEATMSELDLAREDSRDVITAAVLANRADEIRRRMGGTL